MEEEEFYTQAIENDSSVSVHYLKLVALGPGQVGKSTFLKRLLGQMEWDMETAPPETHPPCSTGQAEPTEMCIKYSAKTAALSGDNEWHCLEDLKSQVDILTSLVCSIDKSESVTISSDSESTEMLPSEQLDSPSLHEIELIASTAVIHNDKLPNFDAVHKPSMPTTAIISQHLDKEQLQIADVFDHFDKLVAKLDTERICSEILCNIVDIGGQPAFLDMLPSLTIGPAMYLLFTKLLQDLKTENPVMFKSENNPAPIECYNYTYTAEEVLFTALASISCFGKSDSEVIYFIDKETANIKLTNSLVLLMGTFEDEYNKADESEQLTLRKKEKQLKAHLKDSDFNLLEFENRRTDKLFFRINNKSGGENEIKRYRNRFEKLINQRFRKYRIPIKWLKLSIYLKILANIKNACFVSLQNCIDLGKSKKLQLSNREVKAALRFLHKYVGLIMYFPKNKKLENLVICDPQIVLLSISELIFHVYDSENPQLTNEEYNHFINTGHFSLNSIEAVMPRKDSKTKNKNLLSAQNLVELLVHLNIAAPILSDKYFLPAILTKDSNQDVTCEFEPVYFRFKIGYVPLGFVCALMAKLIGRKDFELLGEIIYKNNIRMNFNGMLEIIIISCPKYFKVYAKNISDDFVDFPYVLQTLCEAVDQVVEAMHHGSVFSLIDEACYEIAFKCPKCSPQSTNELGFEKLAVVNTDSSSGQIYVKCKSSNCLAKSRLTAPMAVWYEVRYL